MGLGSCSKCWDDPCTCGQYYQNYNNDYKIKIIAGILGISENDSLLDDIKRFLEVDRS